MPPRGVASAPAAPRPRGRPSAVAHQGPPTPPRGPRRRSTSRHRTRASSHDGDSRGDALGLGFRRVPRPGDRVGDPSMSSDPLPHLPAPVAPPGAAEVDPQSQPAAPPAEPPEVMHRTRAVDFLGRRTPIVYQNDNGPCPLLAICELPPLACESTMGM
jgi:hypothetical protein